MKILHFADIHLGMENYGRLDSATGLNIRFLDFLKTFDELINKAQKLKPDLILFPGDAYKDRNPTPTHQRELAIRIRKLAKLCPVVLVVGNHDLPQALEKANTLDIFSALRVENVVVSREIETLNLKTKSGPIQIVTLPWITKSKLLEKDQLLGKSADSIQKLLISKISTELKKEIKNLNPKIPAVIAAHATLENATYGSERSVMLGQDLIIPQQIFINSKIKYTALGHIHKYQVLRQNPPIVYAGSPDRIDFGEEKDKKGFVMVEINGKTKVNFIPLETRNFVTVGIKLKPDSNPEKEIKKQIQKYDLKDAIIRVKVKVPEELTDQVHESDIRSNLKNASHISSISFEIPEIQKILEKQYLEQSVSPLETMKKYLEFRKFPKSKIKIFTKYLQKILDEKEI